MTGLYTPLRILTVFTGGTLCGLEILSRLRNYMYSLMGRSLLRRDVANPGLYSFYKCSLKELRDVMRVRDVRGPEF
jgi:hypothetical protein